MRKVTAFTTTVMAAGVLAAGLVGVAGPAGAATVSQGATPSHRALARAEWKAGAEGSRAEANEHWTAARKQLAAGGKHYFHERDDLTALLNIPGSHTTAKQRATVRRATRELNGFFRTPGLYSVKPGNAKKIAKADWIKSTKVDSAHANVWLAATVDELNSYGKRYAPQRADLVALQAVPLTSTTAEERATARRAARALNAFFHTHRLHY